MTNQPFFAKRENTFIPNPVSNGPWDPNSMHGRVVIGLLAHVIEEQHGSDEAADRGLVGEDADHIGAPFDFFVQPLDRVG